MVLISIFSVRFATAYMSGSLVFLLSAFVVGIFSLPQCLDILAINMRSG